MAALLVPTVVKPSVATFLPTRVAIETPVTGLEPDTITVDAGDEHRWRYVDLDRGAVLLAPDTAGWDLMLRRFSIVPSGPIAAVQGVPFDSVAAAPDTGYATSRYSHDTTNAATARWYTYSYFSHLLSPKPDVYVLRTTSGRIAKIQVLSYYCPGPTPGCVTFHYVLPPAGSSRFIP